MTSKRPPPSEAASTVLVPSTGRSPMKREQTSNVPEQRMRVWSPRQAFPMQCSMHSPHKACWPWQIGWSPKHELPLRRPDSLRLRPARSLLGCRGLRQWGCLLKQYMVWGMLRCVLQVHRPRARFRRWAEAWCWVRRQPLPLGRRVLPGSHIMQIIRDLNGLGTARRVTWRCPPG